MWRKGTIAGAVLTLTVAASAYGQGLPSWRKVGGTAVELMLTSPATGPVDRVWFGSSGEGIYARTRSGRVFLSTDSEVWVPANESIEAPAVISAEFVRPPEVGARVVNNASRTNRIYALGKSLYRSDDGGRTWTNLTSYRITSIVGTGQHSVAVSPNDPEFIVLANDFGVWRSHDGGLSWSGMNQFLPNLAVKRLAGTPSGLTGTRIQTDSLGELELPAGGSVWLPAQPLPQEAVEAEIKARAAAEIGVDITAVGIVGLTVYAGSADGRIWQSVDGARSFLPGQAPVGPGRRIERFFVDPANPSFALAAVTGRGPHVLRTISHGNSWDSIDGNLPDAAVHGVTADRAEGAVYVATDQGIFWADTDLQIASAAPVIWNSLSTTLPTTAAMDVTLDPAGVQLYAALDGYGVYAMAAPHLQRSLRIVNGGDYSNRPAAPGSLLSIGGRVRSARGGNLDFPVLAASDSESQVQVAFEAVGPSLSVSLQGASRGVRRDLAVLPVSPVIMVGRDGTPMLWDADSGLPLDPRKGSQMSARVQIWATGLGRVRPNWPTGTAAPHTDPPSVVAQIKAFIDGVPLKVGKATLVPDYIGFYLIEVELPSILNVGTSELWITADSVESNRVPLVIEQ